MAEELTTAPAVSAVPPSSYTSDLIPPQITVLSPLQGSIIDTDAPFIEILVMDPGSDIDPNTIRLILDRMNITAPATMERLDGPEQAPVRSYKISYQPSASLKEGIHEIYFSVRDKAGNLAELNWTFQVELRINWGIRVSGSNTLQFNLLQVDEAMDSLDLTVQGQYQDTDIQLHLFGRATNSPGITPLFSYENYNFYLDSYSLGVYQQRFGLVLGYTGVALDSELFQNSPDKGWVAGDTIETTAGQYNWVAFSGETLNASGLGMDINEINGITGKWSATTGWGLGGFYVRLDGEEGSNDFIDIKGNSPYGKPVLFRYEVIHGDSKGYGASQAGNGVALHLDKSIAASVVGVDYMLFEPEYPALEYTPIFTPGRGGAQKYTIRSATPFADGQSINVDLSYAENNLDGSLDGFQDESLDEEWDEILRRENVNIGYNVNQYPNFNFNTSYQWGSLHRFSDATMSDEINNNLSLGFSKSFELTTHETGTLQTSLSLGQTSGPGSIFNQAQLIGNWTQPVGLYNLSPSVNWMFQNWGETSSSNTADFRVTVDRQFHPELSRSSLTLFHNIYENTDYPVFETKTGLAVTLYFKTWGSSNLTVTYNGAKGTKTSPEGYLDSWEQYSSLIWKSFF